METIELPSMGLLYPESNPLSNGKLEIRYPGAREEDILTTQAYIADGTVLDRVIQSVIVTKINYDDLVVGDKNALMVAVRILLYGKKYTFNYGGEPVTVDLSGVKNRPFDIALVTKGINSFNFTFPNTGTKATYKILTSGDEKEIQAELNGLKKINKDFVPELSTRLKYIITSVEGKTENKVIREFVDTGLISMDSRALREHIKATQPDVDLTFFPEGSNTASPIPVGVKMFWPDSGNSSSN